jgi:hypothetical protein
LNAGPRHVVRVGLACSGGPEKLSDVAAREGKKIKEFGYIETAEPKPLIRLACQQGDKAGLIVIPPWNGNSEISQRLKQKTVATKIRRRDAQQPLKLRTNFSFRTHCRSIIERGVPMKRFPNL